MRGAVAGALAAAGCIAAPAAFADDLGTISQRVTAQLLSDTPSDSTVEGYMSSLQSNGSWSDISYSSTAETDWSPGTHLDRMEAMAEAYENPASGSLYHNATLAADLQSAMNYWFSFTANSSKAPSSAENYGNPTPYSSNWYDNNISGPQALGATMALASSVFTSSELAEGQKYLANASKSMPNYTGQNTVDLSIVGVYGAIASQSSSAMASAFQSMNGTVFVSNFGTDGIQADSTYHIHGIQLYMGGYGTSYINDMLNWASLSAGTSYALNATQEQTLVNYLLDGTQWFIRGQTMDLTADGRQVSYTSYVGSGDGFVNAIEDALTLGNYRTSELQAFLARQQATVSSGSASTSTTNALIGNRDFYDSDIMVQQRAGWYASVKVDSTRTSDPETGNDQGLKNLYLGDGVNQIMVTGNEYLGIQPVWNWYRLPGTTVEQDGRSLTPSGTFGSVYGTSTYAGGVSDGMYGAEALAYNRFDVQADKSWYFFDNEEVALGAGIHSTSTQYEVDTTLNQCLLTTPVSYETTASSAVQTLTSGSVTPAGLKWVYQGGVGYFFINPVSDATIEAQSQSGSWYSINTAESSATVTENVFTLYIDHGTAVNNGTYAYIAVPGIALGNMDSYLAANPIQVLSNGPGVQAVRQSTLNITQAAFYNPGSFAINSQESVAANASSAVMLQQGTNSMKLSASSPAAAVMPLNITLRSINLSGGSSWFDAMGTGVAGFNLPGGNLAGSTVGITLSSDGEASPTVSLISNDQSTNSSYTVTGPVALVANTTFNEDKFCTLGFSGVISGDAGVTKAGPGAMTLSGANTYTGTTTVQAGVLLLKGAGAQAPVTSGGGANIQGGSLVFDYSNGGTDPVSLVRGDLAASYNASGGPFTSGQIYSSSAVADMYGLGYVDNTATQQLTVMYTLYGDTNLDGSVNFADLLTVAQYYGQSNTDWAEGDFNYDGSTNFADLLLLAQNYNTSLTADQSAELDAISPSFTQAWSLAEQQAAVPEPVSSGALSVGALGLMRRRRR